jgi:sortase A
MTFNAYTKLRYPIVFTALTIGLFFFAYLSFFSPVVRLEAVLEPIQSQVIVFNEDRVEWVPELPVRLLIPALGLDAEVQYVGLDESGSGEMAVPSNFTDVGWYKDGVRTGMRGSAVIAGHYNGKGVPEAVFYNLDTLDIGDEVVIMSAERIEDIFSVVKVKTYDYDDDATDVFVSTDGKKRLNLITCGGEWLRDEGRYDKRTVVFTELLTDVE